MPCKNSTAVLTGGVKEVGVSPLSIDEDAGGEPVQREHGRLTLQAEWEGSPPSEWRASQ